MIKKFLHKSFSVLLALLVLFSTISFTVEKHFCGDVLIDVAVFSNAETCDMGISETSKETITKKSCCKDEINLIKGQKELKTTSFEDLNFQKHLFVATYVYTFINLFEGLPQQVIPHKQYAPPLLVADIQVLDQVFII